MPLPYITLVVHIVTLVGVAGYWCIETLIADAEGGR
jgi:hypothetical protein